MTSRPTRPWLRGPWWRWALQVVVTVLVGGLVASVVTFVQVWWVGRSDARPTSDALVVLGASQYDGRPSAVFAARLDHAFELFEAGIAPRIITVGGKQPGDRFTEAEAAAHHLRDRGVPATAVLVVPEGSDTLSSLTAVTGLMNSRQWQSAVIVTDRWHSLRSRAIAEDLGIDAATSPATGGPANRGLWTQIRYIIREGLGYRFYQFFRQASPAAAHTSAV